ncbi:PREDICTED: uncharacterized protein LOC107071803 [Polistes dominula]|uniref:Endosome-associated-trafficking regulator 1 n=1 Tax=Polistes dominula TaxID=743375 RepID=A0ABM1J2B8_POLDO|nr:PREDICTED: uncharacterized protein LOC107071803 [Polistes dominula]
MIRLFGKGNTKETMAGRKKADRSSRSVSKNTRQHNSDAMFPSLSSSDEDDQLSGRRDRTITQDHPSRNRIVENDQQTGQDVSRREENPFSFKHFLKGESQTNYYKTGARPKIYSSSATSPNNVEKDTGGVYSRNPTELPDFVQDHLVIEQCYLNHVFAQPTIPEVDNLPDFALNSVEQRQPRQRNDSKKTQPQLLPDIPFDLTGSIDKAISHNDYFLSNATCSNSINIPVFNAVDNIVETSESASDSGEPEVSNNVVTRDCTPTTDSNLPKLLPDFLNDGPIHSRTNLSNDIGSNSQPNMVESTERRLLLENDRLRQELDSAHRKINEKSIRIVMLEAELASRKEVDYEETAHLEKAVEQVEDNLKRSTKRALSAENTVTSLKKEIRTLTSELSSLRLENKKLRSAINDNKKNECDESSENIDRTVRRLAGELRTAASTAEISLRQLMSGVENLRVLASTLENVDRIEEEDTTTKDFMNDSDDDYNAADPRS